MTRNDRLKVSSWTAILIAAVAVLIASVTLGVQSYNSHQQDQRNAHTARAAARVALCNKAFLSQLNDAQSARLPSADKQNAALIAAFKLISRPGSSVATPEQIADLQTKGKAFVSKAGDYEQVKKDHPYPTDTCPDVKGITVPK